MAVSIGGTGGFVALNKGKIEDCYSQVKLNSKGVSGGFCGENRGMLLNCLSKGRIIAKKDQKHNGFCGMQKGIVKDSYWIYKSDQRQGPEFWNDWNNAILEKDLQSKSGELFKNWNKRNMWNISDNIQSADDLNLVDETAEIIERETVVEISNADELFAVAKDIISGKSTPNTIYRLTADINLKGANWEPVGIDQNNPFSGCFDGAGFSVKNFKISSNSQSYAGFFGYIGEEGEVHHLTLDCVLNQKGEYVSAMCGCNDGLIDNCIVRTALRGSRYTGGFVAQNNGTIKRCSVLGKIHPPLIIAWWWPLAAIVAINIALSLMFAVRSTLGTKELFAPVIMDPNAKPVEIEKETQDFEEPEMTDTGASFIMNAEMPVSSTNYTGAIGLRCPYWSKRGFVATAVISGSELSANGSSYSGDAVVYQSGLIAPGYGVDVITLSSLPDGSSIPPGKYAVAVQLEFYDMQTNECGSVNTSAPLELVVN